MPERLPVFRIPDFSTARALSQVFHVVDLQTHRQKHQFIQAPHKHDFYLLLYISEGSGTHTIDFTTFTVRPHSVFFLSPGQVHAWDLSDDTQGTVLFFSSDFYQGLQGTEQVRQFSLFRAWQHPPVLYTDSATLAPVAHLLQALQTEYAVTLPHQTTALQAYLRLLLIHLDRLLPNTPNPPANSQWPFQLFQLELLVEQHYRDHQPVKFYANALHLSSKHLNELCKQNLGKTTTDLLQARLVLEAKRLLTHSPNLSIAQIGSTLGFEDNSYFSRFFKKQTSTTPEQFRQKG